MKIERNGIKWIVEPESEAEEAWLIHILSDATSNEKRSAWPPAIPPKGGWPQSTSPEDL